MNDSLLSIATNANDSSNIIASNVPLQDSINGLQRQIQDITQIVDSLRKDNADSLATNNTAISTAIQMESNERIVNSIYLQTVAKGMYKLDSTQVSDLQNIIYQCPLAGGSAVFKARSLYTLNTMQLGYNDDSLCNLVNMEWRHAQQNIAKTNGLQVYPNPSTGDVTFDFVEPLTEKHSLYIYNLQGQIISFCGKSGD